MDQELVDPTLLRVLDGQIETLTTSGKPYLDENVIKDMKKILKRSDAFVTHCFYALLSLLCKEHCEIRLSTFQIIHQLFNRSHVFREHVLDNFQRIMDLVLETNPSCPLPPPRNAAAQLRREAMKAVHEWHQKFSDTYTKLKLGYNFLKNCKKLDFVGMEVRTLAERRRKEEEERRQQAAERAKLSAVSAEMQELRGEMETCLTQAENCLLLILPDPHSFHIYPTRRRSSQFSARGKRSPRRRRSSAKSSQSATQKTSSVTESPSHNKCNIESLVSYESGDSCSQSHTSTLGDVQMKIEKTDCDIQTSYVSSDDSSRTRIEELLQHIKCEFCQTKGCSCSHISNEPASDKKFCNPDNLPLTEHMSLPQENLLQSKTNLPSSHSANASCETLPGAIVPKQPPEGEKQHSLSDESTKGRVKEETTEDSDEFHEITSSSESEGESDISLTDEEDGDQVVGHLNSEENDSDLENVLEGLDETQREHGLGPSSWSLSIDIGSAAAAVEVVECADNEAVLSSLDDAIRLVKHRFLPAVSRWIQVSTKAGDEAGIKQCLDMRHLLERVLTKVSTLNIKRANKKPTVKVEKSDDEDDFEEVASKEGYEADIPEHLKLPVLQNSASNRPTTSQEWRPYDTDQHVNADPTVFIPTRVLIKGSSALRNDHSKAGPSTSHTSESSGKQRVNDGSARREKLIKEAPTLPFNTDLRHWGEKIEAPLKVSYHSEHRFWTPNSIDEDTVDKEVLAAITSRLINFTGKFEPVKHECRAPLASGKLCPRMDRIKYPFHGRIIPRDAMGKPTRPVDIKHESQQPSAESGAFSALNDEELQREIEAATGINLRRQAKKRGKKKQVYPNLTDISKRVHTSRSRLRDKVLSPKALKRVSQQLNILDQKRIRDKFGNQFHYALKNRPV